MMNILRNWKTTLAGVVTVVGVFGPALTGPDKAGNVIQVVTDPTQLAILAAGIGAILGKDANVTGVAVPAQDSPQQ